MPQDTRLPETHGAHLVQLASDRSRQGRALLTTAVVELFSDGGEFFTESDQKMMTDIIMELVASVETSVKTALADRLSHVPDLPRELAVHFADMESTIAFSILKNSTVLKDPDLISVVLHKTMEHQMAVSMRAMIPYSVSSALAESQHDEVIKSLLENCGAKIDAETFEGLVGRTTEDTIFNGAMIARRDLPKSVASQLYWAVSVALRQDLVRNFDLDEERLDDAIEDVISQILGASQDDQKQENDIAARVHTAMNKDVLGEVFLTLLQSANIAQFTSWLAAATNLREDLARKIMFEEGGECLAAVFKAIGIERHEFLEIFVFLRHGRLGEKKVPPKEVKCVSEFYKSIGTDTAGNFLKRLQRNPQYLDAMRQLDSQLH